MCKARPKKFSLHFSHGNFMSYFGSWGNWQLFFARSIRLSAYIEAKDGQNKLLGFDFVSLRRLRVSKTLSRVVFLRLLSRNTTKTFVFHQSQMKRALFCASLTHIEVNWVA
jgi:hypothetical protein